MQEFVPLILAIASIIQNLFSIVIVSGHYDFALKGVVTCKHLTIRQYII